jgi:pimeloyl-ACP methyl ester carboxylesterase
MPLLGELCRVIAYEYRSPPPSPTAPGERLADLTALCAALGIERAYLAGYASGGATALRFACHTPQSLEGLVLLGMEHPGCLPETPALFSVPTLLITGEQADGQETSHRLATRLAHGMTTVIPQAGTAPHREQPLQLGHAMIRFLLHCERQRNLVRGASFLL